MPRTIIWASRRATATVHAGPAAYDGGAAALDRVCVRAPHAAQIAGGETHALLQQLRRRVLHAASSFHSERALPQPR